MVLKSQVHLCLQNKILHSQLEALHIQLAERDRGSFGTTSGSTGADTSGDTGLQTVISYLRRTKEIVSFLSLLLSLFLSPTYTHLDSLFTCDDIYSLTYCFNLTGRDRDFVIETRKTTIAITSEFFCFLFSFMLYFITFINYFYLLLLLCYQNFLVFSMHFHMNLRLSVMISQ